MKSFSRLSIGSYLGAPNFFFPLFSSRFIILISILLIYFLAETRCLVIFSENVYLISNFAVRLIGRISRYIGHLIWRPFSLEWYAIEYMWRKGEQKLEGGREEQLEKAYVDCAGQWEKKDLLKRTFFALLVFVMVIACGTFTDSIILLFIPFFWPSSLFGLTDGYILSARFSSSFLVDICTKEDILLFSLCQLFLFAYFTMAIHTHSVSRSVTTWMQCGISTE